MKEENKILRSRIRGQVHTKPDERSRLVKLGKALGQAIEEVITLITTNATAFWQCPSTAVILALFAFDHA